MGPVSRALLMTSGVNPDLDPNAFGFNNVSGASLSTLTTSNTITPTGYDATTTWSVTNGGEGSVAGGAFTSSGTISPGQNFRVRGTSSPNYSTTASFLVSIGATQSTWSITTMAQPTEAVYTTPGTYSFIVPAGVTSVSVVAVGGGAAGGFPQGGGAGALSYRNNVSVTPGASIPITVGAGGFPIGNAGTAGGSSTTGGLECAAGGGGNPFISNGGNRSAPTDGGGSGGSGQNIGWYGGAGGGAAGYSGNGGNGGSGQAGTGGSAGGGHGGRTSGFQFPNQCAYWWGGGGGGGVGVYGQGANGTGATENALGGGGGSGGNNGNNGQLSGGGSGGIYGGGGGGAAYFECYDAEMNPVSFGDYPGGSGGSGAVRIIWPGNTRLFPSTNTGQI